MKATLRYITVSLALAALTGVASGRTLKVAGDGRHLVDSDGRPFFWLGDTAWELFHRLDRDEAAEYLENRAAKGFTVIQAVVLDRFDDYDVRQAAYWAMLAGACGHTYGHGSIWQMYKAGGPSVLWAAVPWRQAMDHPGALQMGLMRKLFESRPWQRLVPRQSIILDGPQTGGGKIRAAVADDGSFAFVYSPAGERFTIDRRWLKTDRVNEIWFDPRYGIANRIHTADTQAMQTYTPPTQGRGCDWLLVIEDAHKNYPMPGY